MNYQKRFISFLSINDNIDCHSMLLRNLTRTQNTPKTVGLNGTMSTVLKGVKAYSTHRRFKI